MSQLLLTNNTINPTRNATFTQTFMFPHFITSFCQTLNGGKKFIENKSTFFQVNILEKKLKLIYFPHFRMNTPKNELSVQMTCMIDFLEIFCVHFAVVMS